MGLGVQVSLHCMINSDTIIAVLEVDMILNIS